MSDQSVLCPEVAFHRRRFAVVSNGAASPRVFALIRFSCSIRGDSR
jgi:hypothetical protein